MQGVYVLTSRCSLAPPDGYDESAVRMVVAEVLHGGERYEKEDEDD